MNVKVEPYPWGERLDCSISWASRRVKWTIHLPPSPGTIWMSFQHSHEFMGTNYVEKDLGDSPCLIQLKLSFKWRTTIILGTMKDGSLIINNLSIINGFIYKTCFQNGANDISELVNIVKRFCQNQNFVQFAPSDFVRILPACDKNS